MEMDPHIGKSELSKEPHNFIETEERMVVARGWVKGT